METVKRLIIGGCLSLLFVFGAPAAARANGVSTWAISWCGPASTWSGLAGLNNDYPGPATVTGLTVSNGVTVSNMAVGQVIGSFLQGNLEGTATGLPMSLSSFTVTVTLAVPEGGPISRTITVNRPITCNGVAATTPTTSSTSTSITTAAPPEATNVPNPTSRPQPIVPSTPFATIVPLKPSVLGTSITTVPSANTTLPQTGGHNTRSISEVAAVVVALGVGLVSVARIGRPAKP